jgi:hypothetical protein
MGKKIEAVVGNDVIASETPEYGSEGWDSYVMSLFKPEELIDGKPRCVGLRRVGRTVLGDPVFTGPIHVSPATDNDGPGRATVVYQMVFKFADGQRTFGDVADVWHGNTDDMFAAHPVACASTKAEARCWRKALLISAVSAEELTVKDTAAIVQSLVSKSVKVGAVTNGEINDSDKMSDQQRNLISIKCKQLNVDPRKLAGCDKPEKWTKKFASSLITKINEVQQAGLPEEVSGFSYNPNWFSL